MKEKVAIGVIGVVTCLLIIITLADVIWTNDSVNMDATSNKNGDGIISENGTTGQNGENSNGNSGESGNNSSGAIINPEGMSLSTRIGTPYVNLLPFTNFEEIKITNLSES